MWNFLVRTEWVQDQSGTLDWTGQGHLRVRSAQGQAQSELIAITDEVGKRSADKTAVGGGNGFSEDLKGSGEKRSKELLGRRLRATKRQRLEAGLRSHHGQSLINRRSSEEGLNSYFRGRGRE